MDGMDGMGGWMGDDVLFLLFSSFGYDAAVGFTYLLVHLEWLVVPNMVLASRSVSQ